MLNYRAEESKSEQVQLIWKGSGNRLQVSGWCLEKNEALRRVKLQQHVQYEEELYYLIGAFQPVVFIRVTATLHTYCRALWEGAKARLKLCRAANLQQNG